MKANELMTGIYVGKALAEGDYLAAAPFFSNILTAIKTAAPALLKNTAATELAKIQAKLAPSTLPAASGGPLPSSAPVQAAPPGAPWGKYVLWGAAGLGGFILWKKFRRGR